MKRAILVFFIAILGINCYAQDIPTWIRGGMSINEIKNELKITRMASMGNMEIGTGRLGIGSWEHRKDGLYIYHEIKSFSPFQSGSIYQFNFNSENRLDQFWVIDKFDSQQLINNFTSKYGSFTRNETGDYIWYYNLPQDLLAILITIESNNHTNILYMLKM